ncbi:hypothetical protein [Bradyrhizobium yuanmingense]|uniref:hypothetical protein n=1 Tax=Bradyrhizobium yuanmingense TaxID=108015 RepID=UPI0023B8CEE8|nr:hypothetical protein [Bradyrhizobium yuanmingense]MDF0581964.1 hypothetical protein [Bradyrhizobium yuanmingense]
MKGLINPLQVSRFLRKYDDAAVQKGLKLSIGFDFREYLSITRVTPTKEPTTRFFQTDRSPISLGDGFWTLGVDKNENVALLQAVRIYELSGSSLADHIDSMFRDITAPLAHPRNRWTCTAPSARNMNGKIAYHGDLWVGKEFRGKGIPEIAARVAFGVSFAMWDPDFMCGLVAQWVVDKGVLTQEGYRHSEPGGLHLAEQDSLNNYLLVWLTGEELKSYVHGSIE